MLFRSSSSTLANPLGVTYGAPGTYTITLKTCDVNDATCCDSTSQTVTVYPMPTAGASSTDATCFGGCNGMVAGTASGGTPLYTYDWDGGLGSGQNQTNVCSGTYTLTVTDANGCIATTSANVLEPNPIDLYAVPTDESCLGACDGTLWGSVSGGTGPYTYTWSGGLGVGQGFFNVCPGTYTVTVVDANGCIEQNNWNSTTTINSGTSVIASFTYFGNQCLSGNSFLFNNTGTASVTYFWDFGDGFGTSTDANPFYTYATAGTYTVVQTVSNGGCSDTYSLTVNVYDDPTASIAGTDPLCFNDCNGSANLTVNGGTGPYTYNWTPSGQTIEDAINLCSGTNTVNITDANGCAVSSAVNLINPPILSVSTSGTDASCNSVCDGIAVATPSGGTGAYTYLWDDLSLQTTATATGL